MNMIKVIKSFCFIAFTGLLGACEAETEQQSLVVQQIPEPISNWVRIENIKGGQVITAADGYVWLNGKNERVYLNGDGEVVVYVNSSTKSSSTLGQVHTRKLHTYQITNLNSALKNNFDISQDFNDIYYMRVFGSWAFAYDLTIYVKDSKAKYIRVCLDFCHTVKPKLITTRSEE